MLRSTLIILLSFCFGCGCGPSVSTPLQKWNIIITSPYGDSRTYSVMSYQKPSLRNCSGGQTLFVDRGSWSEHEWEKSIVAPTGWLAEVKMDAEKSSE